MRVQKLITGIVVANVFAMIVIWFTKWLSSHQTVASFAGVFVFSDFIIVPVLMGIIAAYFWRDLNLTGGQYVVHAIYNSLLAVAGAYFFWARDIFVLSLYALC